MASEVLPAQLVQLAEFNLRTAKRRQMDKMEALWLSIQSVILLESALNKRDDFQVSIPSPTSRLPQPTKESIYSKIANAKTEVQGFLKAVITKETGFHLEQEFNEALLTDWLKDMLDYFKNKFSNDTVKELQPLNEERQVDTFASRKGYDNRRGTSEIVESFSRAGLDRRRGSEPVRPTTTLRTSPDSVREKISYQRMMMKFTTSTAAKYGLNVLDPFCNKAIEDYRNANVCREPELEESPTNEVVPSYDQPTIRRRSTSIIEQRQPIRPRTLDLATTTNSASRTASSISTRISSAVSELKTKAERLRRRNTITSPIVPWQTAIKQHKSMISDILNDFNAEHDQDQNDSDSDSEYSPYTPNYSPGQYMDRLNSNYSQRSYTTKSLRSVQFSYETKTVRKQYFENGVETHSTTYSEGLDSNGNRHEIYRRGSILDNDVKVTYSRSGSLTPEAGMMPKLQRRSYSLHSFEPISPVTEICTLPWDIRAPASPSTPDPAGSVSISEDDILHTLANSVLEMANKSFDDQRYEQAQSLYEQALAILNRMYKFSGKFEPSIIPTLKQCGLIRKFRGDSLGAIGIFEQCIGVIEKRENGHCNTDYRVLIAELWFEMGNALIIEGEHSETIGHSVIAIMRERETAEALDAPRSVCSDMDLEFSYNAYTTKGQSYPVGAFEALSCYQKAYCKIESLKLENGDEREIMELSAKVLLKIGDCSLLIGDLEVGTNFYESALNCFQTTETPYSLSDNAHVLVMMGFLQYIGAGYSKAVVMLQCATIMFHRMETNGERYEKTEFAMVKSLLCFTNLEMEHYDKAVSMGVQAKRLYDEIFGDEMETVNKAFTWLIAQTMFTVSKAYHSMRMYEHAIDILVDVTSTFGPNSNLDTILRVRILELIGLCYEALDEAEKALDHYNQALEVYRDQSKFGYTSSALEHTLLSRTAGLHVSMRQYDEAAMYVDPSYASRDIEEDIRSDMVTLLHHLGETHTLASHVDKAIECYHECLDMYLEIHGQLGPDIVETLGKLANMYHVKSVQSYGLDCDSLFEAEKHYKQAMDSEFSPMLALRYANFLFYQSSFYDAIYILQQLLETEMDLEAVTFSGLELILIPSLLQAECDEDELTIGGKLLVQYLLVLALASLDRMASVEYYVLDMIYESDEDDTLTLSVIGYSLLELRLYGEAYAWFDMADRNSSYPASTVAWENKLFCVGLELFRSLQRGFLFLYEEENGLASFPSDLQFEP